MRSLPSMNIFKIASCKTVRFWKTIMIVCKKHWMFCTISWLSTLHCFYFYYSLAVRDNFSYTMSLQTVSASTIHLQFETISFPRFSDFNQIRYTQVMALFLIEKWIDLVLLGYMDGCFSFFLLVHSFVDSSLKMYLFLM